MGGFLIVKTGTDNNPEETKKQLEDCLRVFSKKGLPLNKKMVAGNHQVYIFKKYRSSRDNILSFDSGDFIAVTGTLFYNGKMGPAALKELFEDFSIEKQDFIGRLLGNYCLIVWKEDRLFLCSSPSGLYRIYSDQAKNIISSSFLAVLKSLKERTLGKQEFFEYIFDGAQYGGKTVITGVELLDSKSIYQLSPGLTVTPKKLDFQTPVPGGTFNETVKECAGQLIDYYSNIRNYYGDSVCSGLTSGMDTRLMLACMRNVGIKPYLYVYGKPEWLEVKIARMIAAGEGLEIDVEDKSKFPVISKDEYPGFIERQYYMIDGIGIEGIFDNGSDMSTRFKRVEKAQLQMNGGGYQLRLFYSLPNKPIAIKSYLQAKHDGGDYSMCRDFDKRAYFLNLEKKIKNNVHSDEDRISRKQVEALFFDWRVRYWTGVNHMINEQLADALAPGIDPQFIALVLNVPFKYMYLGIFQAAVIKLIHPAIARYPSQYGYNFYDYDKIPWRIKMDAFTQFNTPTMFRPYLRKNFINQHRKANIPYYLDKEYRDLIFPSGELSVSKYVDITKIKEPAILSRVLSVELLLNNMY